MNTNNIRLANIGLAISRCIAARGGMILFAAAVVSLAIIAGCHSAPTKSNGGNGNSYQLQGAVVTDFNRGIANVQALIMRDSVTISTPSVSFDGDSLVHRSISGPGSLIYSFTANQATAYTGFDIPFIVRDSSRLRDTLMFAVPDTFTILTVTPFNRILTGLRSVPISWSTSDSANGYIIAAVRRNVVYTGAGYSQYVTSLNTAGTLPSNAFALPPGQTADTGWYYLFVYSYTGSPDSALTADLLPVPLPSQLADNIDVRPWTGHFGTVVVTWRDSMHVVTNP